MKDPSLQERAIHCLRRLALGICNEPHRCSISVNQSGDWPRLAVSPCANDYPIIHGSDGRQTKAFMAIAQRMGVQYELVDGHGIENPPRHNSSYLNQKTDLESALSLIEELAFLLFGRRMRLHQQSIVNDRQQRSELKVRIDVDRSNAGEMADVAMIADLVFPFSWNQLDTLIKVRPGGSRRKISR